jgi:NAD(P)-dependent dehydrogenase (short-subunit alcohol dehydrogenase family)
VASNTVWKPPGAGFVPYVASKSAVVGFTRALAVELGPQRHHGQPDTAD